MIKKITTILFSLVFVYSYLLYYIIACFQLSNLKSEVDKLQQDHHYANSELIRLSFKKTTAGGITENTFTWHSEEEFSYKGNLYDVMEKEETTDSIQLYCIQDNLEAELLFELKKHVMCFTHDASGKKNHSDFKFLLKDFICQFYTQPLLLRMLQTGLLHESAYRIKLPLISSSISVPPPRYFNV